MANASVPTRARPAVRAWLAVSLGLLFLLTAGLIAAVALTGRPWPWQMRLTWVDVHLAAVIPALGLAAVQLVAPKGTLPHRTLGYVWCALIVVGMVTSFLIELGPGAPQPIPVLSRITATATLVLLAVVIYAGRTGRARLHRGALYWIFGFMIASALFAHFPFRTFGELAISLFR